MPDLAHRPQRPARAAGTPWTRAGEPDPDFGDEERRRNHLGLTDACLTARFLQRRPYRAHADYDEMIRALGYVWECRHDGTLNVTGYRCAACGERRGLALDE
jgi:hypothetical protein